MGSDKRVTAKPILFSGPMVRAILEGRKTQTRRIVKPQPDNAIRPVPDEDPEPYWNVGGFRLRSDASNPIRPKARPGEEMWVRETWNGTQGEGVAYRATEPHMDGEPWRPSIFMPRWASRLTLAVKAVRVERLQGISEQDAKAEGVIPGERSPSLLPCQRAYRELWNEINGPGSWDANPWVWVYEFEVKR